MSAHPQIVHRYAFPLGEAIELLLGDAAGDCQAWKIRIEDDEIVIDVVEPAHSERSIEVPADFDHEKLCAMIEAGQFRAEPLNENPERNTASVSATGAQGRAPDETGPDTPATEGRTQADQPAGKAEAPELKGGPLAQRAAILCGEKPFRLFIDLADAEEARSWVLARCKVESRRMLDHDERAAEIWRKVDGNYRLWLEGHDVQP